MRTLLLLLGAAARLRLLRYEIAGHSMEPTLTSGDRALGIRRPRRVGAGQVIVFEHPQRAGFEVVKRVRAVNGDSLVVAGDHPGHDADGASLGAINARRVLARLLLAYHPRPLRRL